MQNICAKFHEHQTPAFQEITQFTSCVQNISHRPKHKLDSRT